jgi:hypothetical protein
MCATIVQDPFYYFIVYGKEREETVMCATADCSSTQQELVSYNFNNDLERTLTTFRHG